MGEFFAEILVILSEFALNIQEFFFRKKREKRRIYEEENNLPKKKMISPYQRVYILLGFMFFVGFLFLIGSLFFTNGRSNENVETIKELLEDEREAFGVYPKELHLIIRNNPLRVNLLEDSHGNNFHYQLSNNGESYRLFSSGKDGKPNTKDDIQY